MEFILFTNHDSLKHLNSQSRLNAKHARWIDFLQQFDFTICHKFGKENKVVDALSRKPIILSIFCINSIGFDSIKGLYTTDPDFKNIWATFQTNPPMAPLGFAINDGFLTKASHICILMGSLREFVIQKLHGGGLAGHFEQDKTMALVVDRFF